MMHKAVLKRQRSSTGSRLRSADSLTMCSAGMTGDP